MSDIAFASATRLAALIRQRRIGCLELLDHYWARVERYNPKINAIVVSDIAKARKRAREADAALARGESWGPFHGVPMTVKESFDVAGWPTTWGVPAFKDRAVAHNAVAVDRWLKAGVTLFGKTNVPVMLADGQSANPVYGRTNNPRDLTRTPGGSSGGSAAALAAGLTGIEMGSDIASSIRNPAHVNGVYGHKPTYGIVPVRGHTLGGGLAGPDINVAGPLARSAGDLQAALGVLAGPDDIEASGLSFRLPRPRHTKLKDFRIGFILDHPVSPVANEVSHVLAELADFLRAEGATVSDTARPAVDFEETARLFGLMLAAANSGKRTVEQIAAMRDGAAALDAGDQSWRAQILRGSVLAHREWLQLNEERQRQRWAWHEWFKDYDLLLCPVYGLPAHEHVEEGIETRRYQIDGRSVGQGQMLFWAGLTGLVHLPSTAAPAGFTPAGLPVGVQIVGPHFGDRTTIRFARLLEQAWQRFVAPPGYV